MTAARASKHGDLAAASRLDAGSRKATTSRRPPRPPPRILLLLPLCIALSCICLLRYRSLGHHQADSLPFSQANDAVRTLFRRSDNIGSSLVFEHSFTGNTSKPDPYAHDVPCYIPYHQIYARLPPAVGLILLFLWLMFLFSFLGIVASDFFCPNLSTIAARLGLPDDVAGATMVGWANGAPDLFSTFASIKAGSGSLAIGELIGAASFICSVVAGSMVLVKPFKVSKFNFFRDVGFFTIAVAFALNILRDGKIQAWESRLMIVLYVAYVVFVTSASYWRRRRRRQREKERKIREAWDDRVPDVAIYQDTSDGSDVEDDEVPALNDSRPPYTPQRQQHHHERSRSLSPLVIPSLQVTRTQDDYFSSPAPVTGTADRDSPSVPFPSSESRPEISRRRSATVTSASGRKTPTSPFPTGPRHHAHSSGHARSISHAGGHMHGRMSLLGAIEFRDVVNALQADSHASKTLAAFEFPASSASSTTSGGSQRGHRRSRSPRRRGSSSEPEESQDTPAATRPLPSRPNTFSGRKIGSEHEEFSRTRSISGPTKPAEQTYPYGHNHDLLSAQDICVDDPWKGVPTPDSRSSTPGLNVQDTAGEVIPNWGTLEMTSDEDQGESTAGESDITARPSRSMHSGGTDTPSRSRFPAKAAKVLGMASSGSAQGEQNVVPAKAQRVLGIAEESEVKTNTVQHRMRVRDFFYILAAVVYALFPTLHHFRHKGWLARFTSLVSTPAVLLLNLTLPVVDESTVEEDFIDELEKERLESVIEDENAENDEDENGSDSDSERSIKDLRQRQLEMDAERGSRPVSEWDEEEREERERLVRAQIALAQDLHSPVATHQHGHHHTHSNSPSRKNSDPERGRPPHLEIADGHLAVPGTGAIPHQHEHDHANTAVDVPQSLAVGVAALPSLEEDTELRVGDGKFRLSEEELARYVTAIQCLLAPLFAVASLFGDELEIWYLPAAAGVGLFISTIFLIFMRDPEHITRVLTLCLIGFFVAVVWILTIVNEVVGVLQTVGHIFHLSDAILGLTIFAMGNSLGDLVANVTVARMGYPLMALSACFGGPMLNILLGIGFSGTYMTAITHKPVTIQMNTTLFVSGISLLAVLVTTLVSVPLNGYVMSRRWAYGIIAVYVAVMSANVVVEILSEADS